MYLIQQEYSSIHRTSTVKKITILFISAFFATSCTSVNHVTNDYIQVEDDPYKTVKIYNGLTNQEYELYGLQKRITHTSNIRSIEEKDTGEFTHQLYAAVTYFGSWHNFERAAYRGGRDAGFTAIDQTQEYCTDHTCKLTERFSIPLDEDFLIENRDGFTIKVFAESGEEIILSLTNFQISAQLSYLGLQ